MAFPFFKQHDAMDCGPTCLRMIAKYHGKDISIRTLREAASINREGVSFLGVSQAAERIGFRTLSVKISFDQLDEEIPLPCIVHWQQNHFVVIPPQNYDRNRKRSKILIADPAQGLIRLDRQTFLNAFVSDENKGLALILEPTPAFLEQEDERSDRLSWSTLIFYLRQHKRYFTQVLIGLFAGSLLQLIFPFLTQNIVDIGISNHNLQFIYLILVAQFMLFFARTTIEFIRSRLLLFISTRINISLLSNFWCKLMRLPLSYFDTKLSGDIQQRLHDQRQIELFLTGSSLSALYSVVNLSVFSIVLLIYSLPVFGIFAVGSVFYFAWMRLFMERRRDLNYRRFAVSSQENTATMQLIQGMQEIRLNNSERHFRWGWERLQAKAFKLNFKSLSLNQYQQSGAFFINEGKNILITFFVAKLVLDGHLTLGAMLAIQYIIGQLNSPVEQLVAFSQSFQDAKIALERLNEIQQVGDEELSESGLESRLPAGKSIEIRNLSFAYVGAATTPVLKNINLQIPERRVTAIVGMSGSGKTTLLRLLLKFYDQYSGSIFIGSNQLSSGFGTGFDLKAISHSFWRNSCGCVMQDGYIFNESIAGNIAVGEDFIDRDRLLQACRIANILTFIESLPLGFNTKIGAEGNGISQGQKQRILIARAVYKNPEYLFFDEATNALDANNERVIMDNLQQFFKGRTVLVVAHRLSTVMNADQIVVLHNGEIVETGRHEQLSRSRGHYYDLVKNQLELGN